MTESDWLSTDSPSRLFQHVRSRLSARKLQLLACGCCRLLDGLFSDTQRAMLAVVERHADGLATRDEYQGAIDEFGRGVNPLFQTELGFSSPNPVSTAFAQALMATVSTPADFALQRAVDWVGSVAAREAGTGAAMNARREMNRRVCGVFREVAGNPFCERVVAGPEWTAAGGRAAPWMLRVSETARGIALGVQTEQAYDRLPILADALEDDGCTDDELLFHFRHHPTHLRGCWALDLVLGKS
ncbi:MAG: hypothetical protein MUF18_11930 [Fimbriiglobus sp.]|jgi:hypothetical protein|nr:hypothetical protein [Fimbriiglobus sp.]